PEPGSPIWSHSASYGSVHRATVPLVNSFTFPATLPSVLLANPGACVTGASGSAHTDRAVERHRPPSRLAPPMSSDSCTGSSVSRWCLSPASLLRARLLRLHSVPCPFDLSPVPRRPCSHL